MGHENAIEERLAPYVARLQRTWPGDARWQEREGTLVSADVSGFTALSERLARRGREGAEELNALIGSCFDGMIHDCLTRGGDVLKFGGDALLVWFEGPDHAFRAANAALAIRRTLRQERRTSYGQRVELSVSTGLDAGTHHFFVVRDRFTELIATGPGATATVDAESAASAGQVVVTPRTLAHLPRDWFHDVDPELGGAVLRRRHPLDPGLTPPPPPPAPLQSSIDFIPPERRHLLQTGAISEHRQVAVAFVAFRETDRLVLDGRIDELADRLQELMAVVCEVCDRYEVHGIDTDVYHDGGKFLLTSGAPIAHRDNEERLLRAVRDIVDRDPGLSLRVGVNRGYVFAADLGAPERRVYATLGDSVNLAARLQAKAEAGEIVVTRQTMDWATSRFAYDPLPPFTVKGKTAPIAAGRLGARLGRDDRLDPRRTDLVGRGVELQHLLDLADEAATGESRVAVLSGQQGLGRTRLAAELAHLRSDMITAFVRCQPVDRLGTYSSVEPLLRVLVGIDRDEAPRSAGDALLRFLAERAPDLVPFAPLLAVAFAAEVAPTDAADAVPPTLRATRTLQLLVELLEATVMAPTLVIVDDADQSDDASRDLLRTLVASPVACPLLIVCTTAEDDVLPGDRIVLEPLSPDETLELVDALVGERDVTAERVRSIVEQSDGNPLFAQELVAAADDGGPMPSTLEAIVAARVDELDPLDRQLLRRASILGSVVDVGLLVRVSEDGLERRQDRWERVESFLERVGPGTVRFRFTTYHRVVYDGWSRRARRLAHQRVVEELEREASATREHLSLLAYHASRSGDEERTWRHATAAAAAATDAALFGEAANLYQLALDARPRRSAELALVAERAGDVFEAAGRFGAADDAYVIALRSNADTLGAARLWRKRSEVAERRGEMDLARRRLQRAQTLLRAAPWTAAITEQARCESAASGFALRRSDLEGAWTAATGAFAKAQLVGDWPTAAHAAYMLANLVTSLRWKGVEVTAPDVVELFRRAGDPVGEARYYGNRAVDLYYDGDWRQALELYRRSADGCTAHGHVRDEATAQNNIGEILSDQGRYDEARSMFRRAGRTWRAIGYEVGIAIIESNSGRLATREGRFDDAERFLRASLQRFTALDAGAFVVEVRLRLVELLLRAGRDVDEALWATDDEMALDPTLETYHSRLRALAPGHDTDTIREWADRAVRSAEEAGLSFDLALALLTRARAGVGADDDGTRAAALLGDLDVVSPPPLP